MYCHYLLVFLIGLISLVNGNAQSRMINAELSTEESHRHLVTITSFDNEGQKLICGAAIIHRRYVLTAAHCINNYKNGDLYVKSGKFEQVVDSKPKVASGSYHKVVKSFIPKEYSDLPCRRHQHDIAVLKVVPAFPLSYEERYKKVNLPEFDSDYENVDATIAGYGLQHLTEANGTKVDVGDYKVALKDTRELRSIQARIISNEECQENARVILTEGTLCALPAVDQSHSCIHDDGGPVVRDGTIIGILNDVKCNENVPELMTRVSSYLPFIRNVLEHKTSADILIR